MLVVTGALESRNLHDEEDVVLVRTLRDSNLLMLFGNVAVLFGAVLRDILRGVQLTERNCGLLEAEVRSMLGERKLRRRGDRVTGVIKLCEAMVVRHGVVLVGPTGGGGTAVRRTLAEVTSGLASSPLAFRSAFYRRGRACVLNPRVITMGVLYGEVGWLAPELCDGLLPSIVRAYFSAAFDDHNWIVRDSPVGAFWIETVGLVLIENERLCPADSERVESAPFLRMVFEVADLAVASPKALSRCGMVRACLVDPD